MRTFLRPLSEQPPDEDDSACVTVKGENGEVMHFMLRKDARAQPPATDPQKTEAIEP